MSYARWATKKEVVKKLDSIGLDFNVKKSGIPIAYDDGHIYIDSHESHNMIIGSTGSGKTQAIILPMLRLSMLAKESVVVNDVKGELYKKCASSFKENGYDIIAINFDNPRYGNAWNPLKVPYELYKEGFKDKAIKALEDVGYYLFFDSKEKESDPFWINSTINYFVGLSLYLFDNAKEDEINIRSIYSLSSSINEGQGVQNFLKKLDNNGLIYINVAGTLKAPPETRGSILAVFIQKIKRYISREELTNMLCTSDFDLKCISNKPTAIFIISGISNHCHNLIPLLINQIVDYVDYYGNKEKRLNILFDEFDSMVPIKDFAKIIEYCRSIKICFTITIRSYIHLFNMYSNNEAIILKLCFGNLIYLLSDDIYTLEEVSKSCGNKENGEPLIPIEELKILETFEGVILMPRTLPFKTNFLPDYKINYGLKEREMEPPLRKENDIQVYNEKF